MDGRTEFRIDFQVMRRQPGSEDFSEYAFGTTIPEGSIDSAAHMALSALQNNEYDVTADDANQQITEVTK